ncbi:MAG: hypothetical protein K2N13_06935 [Paraprevotella sp.]|nr:hypothetical protein [Paraprevotella sp.]
MRKITFLSVLFLLTGWVNAWAQSGLLTPDQLANGKMVAIKAIANNNTNWITVTAAGRSEYAPNCAFELVYNEAGNAFALRNVKTGEEGYIQQPAGNDGSATFGAKETAAWFTASSINYTGSDLASGVTGSDATTIRLITTAKNGATTFFNVNSATSGIKFATGIGNWSIVNLYEVAVYNAGQALVDANRLVEGQDYVIKGAGARSGYAFAGIAGTNNELLKVFLNNTSNAVTTLSEKYIFNIEGTSDSFKLKTKDGKYVKAPDLVDSPDDATVFSLSAKPNAAAGVWNLKMPNTYANMNAATTVANSPSDANWVMTTWNDENDGNGKWEIYPVNVDLPTYSITYIVKDFNGNTVATQTKEAMEGDPFPAVTVGVSASEFYNIPEGTVTANGEYDVTINVTALPFAVSTINGAFASDNHWYQLAVQRSAPKYATYNPESGHVEHSATALGEASAYNVFAFTGDPFNGFKIYNPAAGAAKQLYVTNTNSQSCTFAEEGALFGLYKNNTSGYQFKLVGTDGTHLNDVNNTLGVWTATASASDLGGTFTFTEVEFDAAGADIAKEALAAALGQITETMWGTDPGYIADTEENRAKITTAQAVLAKSNATTAEVNAQTEIINALLTDRIMPEAGKFYRIINALPGFETQQGVKKAMYSNGENVKWGNLNEYDRKQVWTITPTEGGYAVRNYTDQKYPQPQSTQSAAFAMGEEATVTELVFLGAPGQFNVKPKSNGAYSMHAGEHEGGAGVSGTAVGWNGGADGCSAWYIHEVEEPTGVVLENVTFNYTVNGVVKKSIIGNYDTANPEAPATYAFVTIGEMTLNSDNTVTVPCTCNLPFTTSESYANATWYAVDMHGNQTPSWTWAYEADQENNIKLSQDLSQEDLNSGYVTKNRRWAFVGDPFNGFKIYNQAAGETMTLRKGENGNNTISVMSETDDRNVFFLYETNGHIEHSFAWKLTDDSSYLNHQDGTLKGWGGNDEGSSCRVYAQTTAIPTKAFYRIKGVANEMYLTTGATGSRMPMIEDGTTAASIFYYDYDKHLLNYASGLYTYKTSETGAVGNSNTWEVIDNGNDQYIFYASPVPGGGGRYLYNHDKGSQTQANRNGQLAGNNTLWIVEPVTELPVTVSAAGYATLFAPTALTIPADVEVYTGTINTEKSAIELSQVADVILANTAVLVKAAAGTYNFEIAGEAAAVENNTLLGTISTTATPENVYTLQNQNGQVGFYPYTGENINGFKAYVTVAADAEVQGLTFDFGDATGIEEILSALETGEKTTEIYDLAGRRVAKPVKGIYIKGGKKVIVK